LLVLVSHRDAQFPKAKNCPTASVVNAALATHVAPATSVSQSDLLGCSYRQGADPQAVSVSFVLRGIGDPCRSRPRIDIAGHEGCNVTGTRETSAAGVSLLVETGSDEEQLSSDLPEVTPIAMERLAMKVLAETPPPLEVALPRLAEPVVGGTPVGSMRPSTRESE
jgi:hypothetical protein